MIRRPPRSTPPYLRRQRQMCIRDSGHTDVEDYDEIRPAGNYLQTFCIGDWDKLQEVYQSILSYTEKHHYTLYGYFYEEGLNELSIRKEADYITMITVAYQK